MAAKKKGKLGASAGPRGGDNLLYSAHQIWLAGLGALSRAQAGAPKVFEDLMREGSKLQGGALDAARSVVMQAFQGAQKTVNKRVDDVKEQATETWDNLEKIFQSRVQRAMHQLGMPTAEEITALSRKVEELAASVGKLAATRAKPRKASSRPRRRHAG
ncbi:MAG: phasin family protein [Steroidobacteraceae bacterium]|nr:phasin family protein [Steroidobacteraceae bacterium]